MTFRPDLSLSYFFRDPHRWLIAFFGRILYFLHAYIWVPRAVLPMLVATLFVYGISDQILDVYQIQISGSEFDYPGWQWLVVIFFQLLWCAAIYWVATNAFAVSNHHDTFAARFLPGA